MNAAQGERGLLELLDGFIKTKALIGAYKLDLFTRCAEPRPRAQLLAELDLPARSGTILIDACVALGLLDEAGGALSTPPALAPFLVRGEGRPFRTTTYLLDYYDEVFRALVDFEELVRSDGATSTFKLRDYFKDDVREVQSDVAREYSTYMEATMGKIAQVVLAAYPFAGHRRLLDLCGNTGTFCAAVVAATPGLEGAYLDVPACVEIGEAELAARPELAGRVRGIAGDLFTSELPPEYDVITMCRSAMDWGDERMGPIYAKIRGALPPGGVFLIIERMLPEEVLPEALPLYLRSVYFLAKSRTTRYRSPSQHVRLLEGAGFADIEVIEPPRAPYELFQSMKIIAARKE
jgi:demethylspheroidene O-methyltransferase